MKKKSYLFLALVFLLIISTFAACDFNYDELDTSYSESVSNDEYKENSNESFDTEKTDNTLDLEELESASDSKESESISPEIDVDSELYQHLEFVSNGDGTCTLTSIKDYMVNCLVIPCVSPNGEKVTKIGSNAFLNTNLTVITIPEGVETIEDYAFYECETLEIIYIPKTVKNIRGNVFTGCKNIKEVHISDMTAWMGVELSELSSTPFRENTILYLNGEPIIDLVIPDDVIRINDYTFLGYMHLQSITATQDSKLSSIGKSAFSSCARLMRVVLPPNLGAIEDNAFNNCLRLVEVVNLSNINITPSNVNGYVGYYSIKIDTDIASPSCLIQKEDYVFYYDEAEEVCLLIAYLGNETELILPSSFEGMDYIINKYFYSPAVITQIIVGQGVKGINSYAFSNKTHLKNVIFENESKLKYIEQSAFAGSGIEHIVIPSEVVLIGVSTFEKCKSLNSITFEENSNLEVIGANAFNNCSQLSEITIPVTVKLIGSKAFGGCTELKSIIFESFQGWNSVQGYRFEPIEEHVFSNPNTAASVIRYSFMNNTLFRGTSEEYNEFMKKTLK